MSEVTAGPVLPVWVAPALPLGETLDDALRAWARWAGAAGNSQRTITARAYTVRRLAESLDPLTAERGQLIDWLIDLRGKTGRAVTKSSRATYRAQLRAFYAWMLDTGRRTDNPAERLPKVRTGRRLPRPFSVEQVEQMLAACADPRSRAVRAYIILSCYAGLRAHEIAKIRGEDIQDGLLYVCGKGDVEAYVPLHPKVRDLAATMPARGWWFPTYGAEGHVHRCSVSSAVKRAMDRAGVPGTPHAGRHFYGTQALRASGGNLRVAQRALRHASPATTAIYTLVADEELRHAIEGIPA